MATCLTWLLGYNLSFAVCSICDYHIVHSTHAANDDEDDDDEDDDDGRDDCLCFMTEWVAPFVLRWFDSSSSLMVRTLVIRFVGSRR